MLEAGGLDVLGVLRRHERVGARVDGQQRRNRRREDAHALAAHGDEFGGRQGRNASAWIDVIEIHGLFPEARLVRDPVE